MNVVRKIKKIKCESVNDCFLTVKQVLKIFSFSERTLYRRIADDNFPLPVKSGRLNLFSMSAINNQIDKLKGGI